MGLAGLPTQTPFSGMDFVNIEPAPMTAPLPTSTPFKTMHPAPSHTFLPSRIGWISLGWLLSALPECIPWS